MRLYATTAVDAAAVCNDGSPGAFYHRPGVGDGADKCAAALSRAVPLNELFIVTVVRCMLCGCIEPHGLLETELRWAAACGSPRHGEQKYLGQKSETQGQKLTMAVQVGDPFSGRRMVLGRALVRDALGEHAVPDVHPGAAAGDQRHRARGRPA